VTCGTVFQELSKASYDRETFDCGEAELNNFIRTKALRHMKSGISRTMVLPGTDVDENGKRSICAYFTVTPGVVERESFSEREAKRLPKYPVPVFLLAQLAVHTEKQGDGLGKVTLIKALEYLWNVHAYMPVYALIVDCLTEHAQSFYERYGFRSLGTYRGRKRPFLPMKTVKRLFDDPGRRRCGRSTKNVRENAAGSSR